MRRLKNTGKNFWRGLKKGELKVVPRAVLRVVLKDVRKVVPKDVKKVVLKGVPRVQLKKRYWMQGIFWRKEYRRRLLQDASDFRSRR